MLGILKTKDSLAASILYGQGIDWHLANQTIFRKPLKYDQEVADANAEASQPTREERLEDLLIRLELIVERMEKARG